MDNTTIITIAGILGTLVAGLGVAGLNHYFSGRRTKAEVTRIYREKRLSPVVEYVNDIMTLIWKIGGRGDKKQSYAPVEIEEFEREHSESVLELKVIVANRTWEHMLSLKGFDKRLDYAMSKFISSVEQLLQEWSEQPEGRNHEKSEKISWRDVADTARELLCLCDKITTEP
jgi:hypothetical protein